LISQPKEFGCNNLYKHSILGTVSFTNPGLKDIEPD